jgi:hypothetical protein
MCPPQELLDSGAFGFGQVLFLAGEEGDAKCGRHELRE